MGIFGEIKEGNVQPCLSSGLWFTPHTHQFPLLCLAFSPRKGERGCKGQTRKPRTKREGSWESPQPGLPQAWRPHDSEEGQRREDLCQPASLTSSPISLG